MPETAKKGRNRPKKGQGRPKITKRPKSAMGWRGLECRRGDSLQRGGESTGHYGSSLSKYNLQHVADPPPVTYCSREVLSISRTLPKNTATAMTDEESTALAGCRDCPSTISM